MQARDKVYKRAQLKKEGKSLETPNLLFRMKQLDGLASGVPYPLEMQT